MNENLDPGIADGLCTAASDGFEMNLKESAVREGVLQLWESIGRPEGGFAAAAAAMKYQPQPLDVPVLRDTLASKPGLRGITTAQESLEAMMRAQVLLEDLAREFG